jgi:hypothetical protein
MVEGFVYKVTFSFQFVNVAFINVAQRYDLTCFFLQKEGKIQG